MPSIDLYDRFTDSIYHLEGYKAFMCLQDVSDTLLSLAFPMILKKVARMRFSSLPPGSVHSFQQLDHRIIIHFRSHHPTPKNSDSLFSLKQEGKILWSYVARFNATMLEVKNLIEFVAMSALKWGLHNNHLSYSLYKNFSRSYSKLLESLESMLKPMKAWPSDKEKGRKKEGRNEPMERNLILNQR